MANTLYYGDNLDILRGHIPTASVDLIYLDPPFNSNADYNVIYKEASGELSSAQIQAFTDTWHWDKEGHTDRAFAEVATSAEPNVAAMLDSMVGFLKRTDMTAYLVMMTQRLIELRRVLKPTGSLYLHCDPTASHYLKIVLDTIFGPERFVNEIVWRRTNAKGLAFTRFPSNHDIILRYVKSDKWVWNPQYRPHDQDYIDTFYKSVEPGTNRRYALDNLANPNHDRPNLTYEFLGVTRVWRWTRERMQKAYDAGLIVQSQPGAVPRLKRYLDEQEGIPVDDIWTDIRPIQAQAAERLGYPTQKPLALLERIIQASSNPGDVVLDPFCGCGTAICAAQKLERQWIGIDITHLAVSLMKNRLKTMFDQEPGRDYQVVGEPKDVASARQLALDSRYQFQYWAVSLVEALAQEGQEKKKGADKGIDGVFGFIDGANRRREKVIVQVKSGHVTSSHIRDLKGVLEREKAAMGLYICLEPPTRDMHDEATSAGFYTSEMWPGPKRDYRWPRIQIRTIEQLLAGQTFEIPPRPAALKGAERIAAPPAATAQGLWNTAQAATLDLDLSEDEDDTGDDDEAEG